MPLISDATGRMLSVRDSWVICPNCRRGRILPLTPNTQGVMIPGYCKRCRTQFFLSIAPETDEKTPPRNVISP